jgi:hypothetical protein
MFRQKAKYAEPETTWDAAYKLFWDAMEDSGVEL